jgi:hypothetical protein
LYLAIVISSGAAENLALSIELRPAPDIRSIQGFDGEFGAEGDPYVCVVRFTNVGKDAIRIARGVPPDLILNCRFLDGGGFENELVINWALGNKDGKRNVIPSDCDLRIVELYSGESAEMRLFVRVPSAVPMTRFGVRYRADKAIGERFRLWSGNAVAYLTKQEFQRGK